MATVKSINASEENTLKRALYDAHEKVIGELYSLQNTVRIAAFACEARRTLEGYADVLERVPAFKKAVELSIPFSGNWSEFEDASAEVLREVVNRLGALSEEIYEDHNAIEKQFAQG